MYVRADLMCNIGDDRMPIVTYKFAKLVTTSTGTYQAILLESRRE